MGRQVRAEERATLFEREHAIAETLQRSLLPDRLPNVPGIVLTRRQTTWTISLLTPAFRAGHQPGP